MVGLMQYNVFVYGFVAFGTKLVNKQKPIVQKRGNSERNFRRNELYTLLYNVFLFVVFNFPFPNQL